MIGKRFSVGLEGEVAAELALDLIERPAESHYFAPAAFHHGEQSPFHRRLCANYSRCSSGQVSAWKGFAADGFPGGAWLGAFG
jgi:hypothetical protein